MVSESTSHITTKIATLLGKQIVAVCNLPNKNIANIVSEVLILGVVDEEDIVTLLNPSQKVKNGLKIL